MKPANHSQPRRRPSGSLEEATFLDLLRTTDTLSRGLNHILKAEGLSDTQYNVLRILRGSPEGLPCGEIANRMITRDPDVTRLLDRLEKRTLISRSREIKDRRTVMARITAGGLKLLAKLDKPVQAGHRRQLGHLGPRQLKTLTDLLQVARSHIA
jgi:DNA-binding MarR family transcriptional regulator